MSNFNREHRSGGNRNFGRPRFNNDRPDMHQATCSDCGKSCEVPFRPTGSKPVYCSDCFRKNGGSDARGGENRSFGRPRQNGRSNDRQMHDAVCAQCGKNCQIPFRPTSGRDVFCSSCFEKQEEGSGKPRFDRGDSQRTTTTAPDVTPQLKEVNAKLDTILRLLRPANPPTAPETITSPQTDGEQKPEVVKKPKKASAKKRPTASSD